MIESRLLRIIDANLNRAGEGLRVLEEVARMVLDDAAMSQQFKTMRHELLRSDWPLQKQLLQARDSTHDVGAFLDVPGEEGKKELPEMVVANSRRVQESLRVLEETSKVSGIAQGLDPVRFQKLRFSVYTLEQVLILRLLRQEKRARIAGLYVIADTEALRGRSHVELVEQAIRGGASIVQLRDKMQARRDVLVVARELKSLCNKHGVMFIVNDYLDVALAVDADGLHVGPEDLPVAVARQFLPLDKIIGCSAGTVERAAAAERDGADYVAVGSVYPTSSKKTVKQPVGLEGVRKVRQAVSLPLVAIGGINQENAAGVVAAGADAIAVIAAVSGAASPEEAARGLSAVFEVAK